MDDQKEAMGCASAIAVGATTEERRIGTNWEACRPEEETAD